MGAFYGSTRGDVVNVATDSRDRVYVAEVAETALGRTGRYRPDFPSLKKFVRRR